MPTLKVRTYCSQLNENDFRNLEEVKNIYKEIFKSIGNNSYVLPVFTCDTGTNITIGNNVFVDKNTTFLETCEPIEIQDNVFIGKKVLITSITHPNGINDRRRFSINKPIKIENNVFIGDCSTILLGVTIGENSIIAPGTLVNKDVPKNSFAYGIPAKFISLDEIKKSFDLSFYQQVMNWLKQDDDDKKQYVKDLVNHYRESNKNNEFIEFKSPYESKLVYIKKNFHSRNIVTNLLNPNSYYLKDNDWNEKLLKSFDWTKGDVTIISTFNCYNGKNISINDGTFINHDCNILDFEKVTIGENVQIAPKVSLTTIYPITNYFNDLENIGPITIGNKVWIGGNSTILPNVKIGDNSIIAAGSIVDKDVPPNSIVGGNPLRVLKQISESDDVNKKLEGWVGI